MASLRRTAVLSLFLFLAARVAADDDNDDDNDEAPATTQGPDFNGWQFHVEDGTTSPIPIYCGDNQYYSSSGDYVNCCLYDQECVMATECDGNTQLFANGASSDCGDGWVCKTMTVFEEFPAEGPIHTDVFCGETDWDVHTVYRTIPTDSAIATDPVSTAEPRGGNSSPTASATGTATESESDSETATESPSSNDSDSDSDPDAELKKSSSKNGLIAGAVVGPVVGLALIAIALWLVRDRVRGWLGGSKPDAQNPPAHPHHPDGGAGEYYADETKPALGGYGYVPPRDPSKQHHQYDGPSELDSAPPAVYELPAPYVEGERNTQELPANSPRPVSELSPDAAVTNTNASSPSPLRSEQ